jgi:hypothetical protein
MKSGVDCVAAGQCVRHATHENFFCNDFTPDKKRPIIQLNVFLTWQNNSVYLAKPRILLGINTLVNVFTQQSSIRGYDDFYAMQHATLGIGRCGIQVYAIRWAGACHCVSVHAADRLASYPWILYSSLS